MHGSVKENLKPLKWSVNSGEEMWNHSRSAYLSEVLRVREVGQVSVVELLTFQIVTVLARPQITGLYAIGLQELLIGHSKCLTNSLGDDLSLDGETGKRKWEN